VALPSAASASVAVRSARVMLRLTTPSSNISEPL